MCRQFVSSLCQRNVKIDHNDISIAKIVTRERAESIGVYFVRAYVRVALAKFRGFLFAIITRLHVRHFNSIRRDFSNIVVG